MGDDSGSEKNGIPAWQQAPSDPPPSTDATESPVESSQIPSAVIPPPSSSETRLPSESQETLLQQATKFLQDDSVRDAPVDKKRAFLESKGLNSENIEKALSNLASPTAEPNQAQPVQPDTHPPPLPSTRPAPPAPNESAWPQPAAREAPPPIITYPEFLVHSQKPPPIVTAKRLVNTAYVAGGISAAIYGASKYLIQPMFSSLSDARHDYFTFVDGEVEALSNMLTEVVSQPPTTLKRADPAATLESKDAGSDADSTDSDPTELFHRDFGTQTSPSLAGDGAKDWDASSSNGSDGVVDPAQRQANQVERVKALCQDLIDESTEEGTSAHEVNVTIDVFKESLESLSGPSYNYVGAFGGGLSEAANGEGKRDDEIKKMRAEIRSVKGSFLSAKNFPGGKKPVLPAVNGMAAA